MERGFRGRRNYCHREQCVSLKGQLTSWVGVMSSIPDGQSSESREEVAAHCAGTLELNDKVTYPARRGIVRETIFARSGEVNLESWRGGEKQCRAE